MNTPAAIPQTDLPGHPGRGARPLGTPAEGTPGEFSAMLQGGAVAQSILARLSTDIGLTIPARHAPAPVETEAADVAEAPETTESTEPAPTPEPPQATDVSTTERPEADPAEDAPQAQDIPFTPPADTPVPVTPAAATPHAEPVALSEVTTEETAAAPPRPAPAASGHAKPAPQAETATLRPVEPADRPATPATPVKPPLDAAPRLTAQVTERPSELVSQPAATLSASTALTAQASTDKRATLRAAASGDPTADPAAKSPGVLARHAHAGGQTANSGSQPENPFSQTAQPAPANASANPSGASGAAFGLLTAQAATARNGAVATGLQTQTSTAGTEAASTSAGNGPQGPYRAADQARFLRGRPPVPPQALTRQVAVQIQKAVGQGIDRIQIQLKPADLGRVDIRLDVPQDGRASIMITADRQETLDLLQRDARSLQTALQDAGLQADGDSLKFSLRGGDDAADNRAEARDPAGEQDEPAPLAEAGTTRPHILSDDQIDITV